MSGDLGAIRQMTKAVALQLLTGPQLLAFLPALTLAGFWYGGETGLTVLALLLPLAMAIANMTVNRPVPPELRDPLTGLPTRRAGVAHAQRAVSRRPESGETTAVLAIALDDFAETAARHGPQAGSTILQTCADRMRRALRSDDLVVRLDGPRFGAVVDTGRTADLETLIQLATRIQRSVEDPIMIDGLRVFLTVSVGFASARSAVEPGGEALVAAAEAALRDAAAHGTGMIRAFSPDIRKRAQTRTEIAADLPLALDSMQIRPFFQPQIDCRTGDLRGFEALARWRHPSRGLIPPIEFLSTAEDLGLMERLGEVMLYHGLNALRAWDAAGVDVPTLSLNFSAEELRNPGIVDRIRWELDRFDIAPNRLVIEVLETVIAQTSNDIVVRNLRAFSDLGCRIDLDDFGTGHASISAIKRFNVDRIKIDRSFITHIDSDSDQRNIVEAIITLAQRMELATLAEGIETAAEHAVVRELGCDCAQGYAIARPMPFEDVEDWVLRHRTARAEADAPVLSSVGERRA